MIKREKKEYNEDVLPISLGVRCAIKWTFIIFIPNLKAKYFACLLVFGNCFILIGMKMWDKRQ